MEAQKNPAVKKGEEDASKQTMFRPKQRTRKADPKIPHQPGTSSDGSWVRAGAMDSQEISSGDEKTFNLNLTEAEMKEILELRKAKKEKKKAEQHEILQEKKE